MVCLLGPACQQTSLLQVRAGRPAIDVDNSFKSKPQNLAGRYFCASWDGIAGIWDI